MALKRKVRISPRKRAQLRKKAKMFAMKVHGARKTYKALESKIDKTWKKLRKDVKHRSIRAVLKGRRDLLLLLGECNYLASEYTRCMRKAR